MIYLFQKGKRGKWIDMKFLYIPGFIFFVFFLTAFGIEEQTLKEISVFVIDKKGLFIEGLNKSDFEVYENGVKQNINTCHFQEVEDGRSLTRTENPRHIYISGNGCI